MYASPSPFRVPFVRFDNKLSSRDNDILLLLYVHNVEWRKWYEKNIRLTLYIDIMYVLLRIYIIYRYGAFGLSSVLVWTQFPIIARDTKTAKTKRYG